MQSGQCEHARQAKEIAEERYGITKKRFESGGITVTELNTAQQELDNALNLYINHLQTFWDIYYTLRRHTLYDWIKHSEITVDFDDLTDRE